MKKTDKVILAILSIWTFIHCYLIITDLFYSFTAREGSNTGKRFVYCSRYNLNYYQYTDFFIYVGGAWLCFLLYKLLSPKK